MFLISIACFVAVQVSYVDSFRVPALSKVNTIQSSRIFATKEDTQETSGGGHQVKGFPEPSEEDKIFMEKLQEHQQSAPKLTFAEEVRTLLQYSTGFGVLSTLSSQDEGYPSGSVVGFAVEEDGNFIFSFSGMSSHTQDVLKDGRASLTVTASGFQGAADGRVSLTGDMVKVPSDQIEQCQTTYLKKHEGAYWVQFGDFTWFRLSSVRRVRFVGGFARAGSITPEEYGEAKPDEITAFSGPVLGHMNDDHRVAYFFFHCGSYFCPSCTVEAEYYLCNFL